jgi:hypothetical protein
MVPSLFLVKRSPPDAGIRIMQQMRATVDMNTIAAADILVIASSFLEQKACPNRWCCEVKA